MILLQNADLSILLVDPKGDGRNLLKQMYPSLKVSNSLNDIISSSEQTYVIDKFDPMTSSHINYKFIARTTLENP